MQTHYNVSTPRVSPAFGAIQYDAAKGTLKTVLNLAQARDFSELVKAHEANNIGQIVLFGNGKKLSANVFTENKGDIMGKFSSHNQRLFEGPLSFVKRMCKIADKRAKEFTEKVEKARLLDKDI